MKLRLNTNSSYYLSYFDKTFSGKEKVDIGDMKPEQENLFNNDIQTGLITIMDDEPESEMSYVEEDQTINTQEQNTDAQTSEENDEEDFDVESIVKNENIALIKDYILEGKLSAKDVLNAEKQNKNRNTLIAWLGQFDNNTD